jgi:tRNA A-37 threonylcarbamoyl transferase component Bud32
LWTRLAATSIGAVTSVGRYEILRELGRGGMATVYLAHQSDLDRDVALKELRLTEGPEREVARRFLREARLAGSFSHPNIVTVHDYFEQGGTPYIAMEYLPRGPLRPYVGKLALAQVGGVLEGVLAGLAHAEERKVVHRDLKPENLMVTSQGGVKIADFGIAKATSEAQATASLTTAGTTLGTPRYMAPERAMGQELGPWSDLYSVGVIAWELLVGRTPFADTIEPMAVLLRQINDPIPPVESLIPDVPPELSEWIEGLVEKDPEKRTQAASEAWDALDEILLDQLGARWQRSSGLPERPGDAPAPAPVQTPRRTRFSSAITPVLPAAAAAAVADMTAATIAPPTARTVPGSQSAAESRTRRQKPSGGGGRRLGLARLALVAGALAIAGLGVKQLLGGQAPSSSSTLDGAVPSVSAERTDLQSAKSTADRRDAATKLAETYERSADDLRSQGAGGALVDAVESTARAYRRAAGALKRNDGSDYDDAVKDAKAGERAVRRAQRGVGDSQSDDPSDDEGDDNEP